MEHLNLLNLCLKLTLVLIHRSSRILDFVLVVFNFSLKLIDFPPRNFQVGLYKLELRLLLLQLCLLGLDGLPPSLELLEISVA